MSARVRRRSPRSGPSSDSTAKEVECDLMRHVSDNIAGREEGAGVTCGCAESDSEFKQAISLPICRTCADDGVPDESGSSHKYSETVVQSARAPIVSGRLRRSRSPFLSPLSTLSIYSSLSTPARARLARLTRSLRRLEECLLEFATRKEY